MTKRALWLGLGFAWVSAGAATAAGAQTSRPVLDMASAQKAQAACLDYARSKQIKVAIAVHDHNGRLLSFAHMDGAATAVGDIAQWKSRSAATTGFSSEDSGKWNLPPIPGVATVGGGVPLRMSDGGLLGGVGVSGASIEDDIACAQMAVAASLK